MTIFVIGMSSVKADIQIDNIDITTKKLMVEENVGYAISPIIPPEQAGGGVIGPPMSSIYSSVKGKTTLPAGEGKFKIYFGNDIPGYKIISIPDEVTIQAGDPNPVVLKAYFKPTECIFKTNALGTKYEVLNSSGSVVRTWTQTETEHTILKLPIGNYKLHVVSVPEGYEIPADKEFELKDDYFTNVDASVLGNGIEEKETVETITNVPDTFASESTLFYGIGSIVIIGGIVIFFKHCKHCS